MTTTDKEANVSITYVLVDPLEMPFFAESNGLIVRNDAPLLGDSGTVHTARGGSRLESVLYKGKGSASPLSFKDP